MPACHSDANPYYTQHNNFQTAAGHGLDVGCCVMQVGVSRPSSHQQARQEAHQSAELARWPAQRQAARLAGARRRTGLSPTALPASRKQ